MRFFKKPLAITLAMALAAAAAVPVSAATYKDVPASHYAYTAIDWVSNPVNGAFMVGDAGNNFNPNSTLDKFEAAKIIAVAAGYKYSASSITPSEQEYFDRSYENYKPLLDSCAGQYAKWSRAADREIAFLLARGIFQQTDLSQFVTKTAGVETVQNLTKQEACAFLVRLTGHQSTAETITLPYHTPYKDDSEIKADYKKYVYYALEKGIAGGADGYITPHRQVTRAELAQMFYNAMATQSTTTNTTINTTSSISGTIQAVHIASPDVYLQALVSNQSKIYKFAANNNVSIDNVQRAAVNLAAGMTFYAIINGSSEIISLVAKTNDPALPTPTPTPYPVTPTPTPLPWVTPTPTPWYTTPGVTQPSAWQEDEGYITNYSSAAGYSVTIKTQRIRLTGETVTDEKTYVLAANCVITRGSNPVAFSNIVMNDIVTFQYSGNVIYSLSLMEKDRYIRGTLVEKKFIELTGTPVLVIEGDDKKTYELRVTANTYISRRSTYGATWMDLRLGDAIDAQCEYDRLLNVYAVGTRSTVSGTLEEIHITKETQSVVIRRTNNVAETYVISEGTYNIYDLRVGMGLRLYLDSLEVYDVLVTHEVEEIGSLTVIGYIQSMQAGNTIVVVDSESLNAKTYSIKIDNNTTNTATSKVIDFYDLRVNMYVYIVLTSTTSNTAKSVTIL